MEAKETQRPTAQGSVIVGFPLSPGVQARIADNITEIVDRGDTKIIAAWCQETGFFLACHIAEGNPCYWECCGPITQTQADEIAESLKDSKAHCRMLM